jgi:carboxymethylenebutenolidase
VDARHAGTGYLALPESGHGPGVLVLHAWWGLTGFTRSFCDRLAAAGFVALAPDLFGGRTTDEPAEAEAMLAAADANELAHLTRSSLATLRSMPATPDGPVGVVGFSMGASLGLWLSARVPEGVAATAAFYGGQDIDFAGSSSAYLGHYADTDPFVGDDSLVLLEADLHLLGLDTTFHRYPGTAHWFFEADRPEHDPEAAELAWDRTLAFLRQHLAA